jgi:hypothetical protein
MHLSPPRLYPQVWHVRNKLDGLDYAVKSVRIKPGQDVTKLLREVNTLSRMHNTHIVRYYNAWIEVRAGANGRMGVRMRACVCACARFGGQHGRMCNIRIVRNYTAWIEVGLSPRRYPVNMRVRLCVRVRVLVVRGRRHRPRP